jgi:hypothetical protein
MINFTHFWVYGVVDLGGKAVLFEFLKRLKFVDGKFLVLFEVARDDDSVVAEAQTLTIR